MTWNKVALAGLTALERDGLAIAARFIVGMLFAAAAIAAWNDPAALSAETWVPKLGSASKPAAVVLGGLAAGLFIGWRLGAVAFAAGLFVDAVLLLHLRSDHLFNTAMHLMPLVFGVVTVLVLRGGDRSHATLIARLFLGMIFVAQGWHTCFVMGPITFAEQVYVTPFADTSMPAAALWIAGVLAPPTQLLTGIALIAGLRTRLAATIILGFLLIIVFGHLLGDPLVSGPDLHDYALANFAMAAMIAWLAPGGDRFGLRGVLAAFGLVVGLSSCAGRAASFDAHLAAARSHAAVNDVDAAWAAQREYELASAACPTCAAPLAEAAEALVDGPIIFSGAGHRLSAEDGYRRAAALAHRALELAPDDPRAWHALALEALYLDYDWCRASDALEHELRGAAQLPGSTRLRARVLRAYLWTITGKVDAAEADLANLPGARNALGTIALFTGRIALAAERFDASLRDAPDVPITHFWRGNVLVQLGRAGEAIDELRGVVAATHGNPGAVASLAQALAAAGRGDDARAEIAGLEARRGSEQLVDYQIAAAWAMLGERERALDLLTHAVRVERDNWPTWLGGDPRFSSLRGEPRFDALVRSMRFGPIECPPTSP